VTDQDIRALYAYLMHVVEPVAQASPKSTIRWPLSMRWPLAFWRAMFGPAQIPTRPEGDDPVLTRGAYLVEILVHHARVPRSAVRPGGRRSDQLQPRKLGQPGGSRDAVRGREGSQVAAGQRTQDNATGNPSYLSSKNHSGSSKDCFTATGMIGCIRGNVIDSGMDAKEVTPLERERPEVHSEFLKLRH
jgi:hypothetical protein